MANGRFVTNSICADKKINQLLDDTSRLAFTWLVTFADCEGRTYGDPAVVRSMLFPRRQDVTIEQMEAYIQSWSDNEMIIWYEANGDKWIWFRNFDKHQTGLRKDREAPSKIPPPPMRKQSEDTADLLRTNSGLTPEQLPVKLIKEKLNKENDDFFSKLDTWVGCPIGGKSDIDSVEVMIEEYGIERVKLAATWMKEKQPSSMKTALKAMNTTLSKGAFQSNGGDRQFSESY